MSVTISPEKHADTDVYEAEFVIVDEDAEHDRHVIVSKAAWWALSNKAAADNITVDELIEQLAYML